MNEKKSKIHNTILSLLINIAIVLIVIVATHMVYETNDDYAIASRIVDGYAEVNFVNYYLCSILIPLQKVAGSINIYIISQIVLSFAAFTSFLKIILDRTGSLIARIVAVFVITIFSIDHYCTIQFTKTAALLIVVASIIIIDNITNKGCSLRYLSGLLLLYAGVAFRIDGLIAAIGFAGLFVLNWVIVNRNKLKEEEFLSLKSILLFVIMIAAVLGGYGFDRLSYNANTATDDLKAYKEYSELRSDIVDYPVYDYYENNAQAYEKIGISENDLHLIDRWYFDYDGAASKENLEAIIAVDRADERPAYTIRQAAMEFAKETYRSVRTLSYTGIHIVILGILFIWALFALKPKHWIYLISVGVFAVCLYVAVYYMQRPAYRALYIADIGAAAWLLYAVSAGSLPGERKRPSKLSVPAAVIGLCVVIAAGMLALPLYKNCEKSYENASDKVMPHEIAEYCADHQDCFFVWGTTEKKQGENYIKPWMAPDTEAERNIIGTGSWGTKSPYVLDKLSAYEMQNPIKDLVDNEKAFYIGNKKIKRLEEYYNKWYSNGESEIRLELIDTVGGYEIRKITEALN